MHAVNIPWHSHRDPKCRQAKLVELERFDEFESYEEVPDIGQNTCGSW